VPHINDEWLNTLLDDARFSSMDPMLKVRLLLAGMVALNQQPPASQSSSSSVPARESLQGAMARLQAAAATDADEWVKVTAAAAGQLDGRLDLAAVMQQSAVVSYVWQPWSVLLMGCLQQFLAFSKHCNCSRTLSVRFCAVLDRAADPSWCISCAVPVAATGTSCVCLCTVLCSCC
jgi:hypothetical protein